MTESSCRDHLRVAEVEVIEPVIVRQIHELAARNWGKKAIARALGIDRDTVRRYLRGAPTVQTRPRSKKLDVAATARANELLETTAEGNAVVVTKLLKGENVHASVRTVQRAVAEKRRARRAADLASVRFETGPGEQMQIDFGEKKVLIGRNVVRVHLLVATLAYSRRIFVKPFLCERQDDWREGIASAFEVFGGVPRTLLGDNARALVLERDPETQTVRFHPGYVAFCRDWDVKPRACKPYRARTKGKVESGVKFVKRNGLAGRTFESFAALEAHLIAWVREADERVHGTTHERPIDRFEREEKLALRPLPVRRLARREQVLRRRVANDCFVDVATVRYMVPEELVGAEVEVRVRDEDVWVYRGSELVASHARCREPYARVINPKQVGRLRTPDSAQPATFARSLAEYETAVESGAGRYHGASRDSRAAHGEAVRVTPVALSGACASGPTDRGVLASKNVLPPAPPAAEGGEGKLTSEQSSEVARRVPRRLEPCATAVTSSSTFEEA